MKIKTLSSSTRIVLGAAVALAAISSQAADPRTASIDAGESQATVEQSLGKPLRVEHFPLSDTTTWTYSVPGQSTAETVYQVDFDANGKVLSAGEQEMTVGTSSDGT